MLAIFFFLNNILVNILVVFFFDINIFSLIQLIIFLFWLRRLIHFLNLLLTGNKKFEL
jgi:hypothetical protein